MLVSSCESRQETAGATLASVAPSANTKEIEETLIKMERDWAAALPKKDVEAVKPILADDFEGWDGDYNLNYTKASHLKNLEAGIDTWESANLDKIDVKVFGDLAVVRLIQSQKGTYNGRDSTGRYALTDVFAKRNGKWQIVAEHGNVIAKEVK